MVSHSIKDIRWASVADCQVRDIHWFSHPDSKFYRNPRKRHNYGQSSARILADFGGWDSSFAVHVKEATDDEIAEALLDLQKEHDRLRAAAEDGSSAKAFAEYFCFVLLHMDEEGELYPPKYIGIDCNRRGTSLVEAFGMIHLEDFKDLKLDAERPDVQIDASITALVSLDPLTEDQMLMVALRENDAKTLGAKALTKEDHLAAVLQLREAGWGTTDLERELGIKGSDRVVILGIVDAERMIRRKGWCGIDFLSRFGEPDTIKVGGTDVANPKKLHVKRFGQQAWQASKLAEGHPQRWNAMGVRVRGKDAIDKYNRRQAVINNPERTLAGEPTKAEFVEWIDYWENESVKEARQNQTIAPDAFIEKSMDFSVSAAGDMAKAIFRNDPDELTRVSERHVGLQAVYHMEDELIHTVEAALLNLRLVYERDPETAVTILNKFNEALQETGKEEASA